MKELAIIGPTASGKSDLALQLAGENNAVILSLDSLSIYKEIDIASAKPSKDELAQVQHFGVDLIHPDEAFSVATFGDLYREVKAHALETDKNLIIVGGSSFYLKSLLDGLSPIPSYSEQTINTVHNMLHDLSSAYQLLSQADPAYMSSIQSNDAYRIEKMLLLYLETGQTPTAYFQANPPQAIIQNLPIYAIDLPRETLRERIALRTQKMLAMGLVDEVTALEHRYGRAPNSLKAIGIIEVFEYLDGRICRDTMKEAIITHTAQLAKRQQTFNRTQFADAIQAPASEIYQSAKHFLA